MAVKTDVAVMSIQFLKDQPDQIKQKPPTDKRKGKDKLWKNKIQSKFGAA